MTSLPLISPSPERHATFVRLAVASYARVLTALRGWAEAGDARHLQRQNLLRVDDRMLADLGVTRAGIEEELRATQ